MIITNKSKDCMPNFAATGTDVLGQTGKASQIEDKPPSIV